MSSNYPPGVTGREYQIAGPDYEREIDGECPNCEEEGTLLQQGYGYEHWVVCSNCDHEYDLPKYERDGA